jgi:hypothetical protein
MTIKAIDRRVVIGFILGGAAAPLLAAAPKAPPLKAVMYRDPGCGCCAGWARKVEATLGTRLRIVDDPQIAAIKRVRAVPADLQSCHTAIIDGYTIEGHVPPEDIRRLLATRPSDILGLAVPGMPAGSAGMEGPSRDRYQVTALLRGGKRRVFSVHG